MTVKQSNKKVKYVQHTLDLSAILMLCVHLHQDLDGENLWAF